MGSIQLLDCTLRDGAYIVDARFGSQAISGIVRKLLSAGVDLIECGWLKDKRHEFGTSFYHVPEDFAKYLQVEKGSTPLVAMIDWDRYDDSVLPVCDHQTIDAVRVVFPRGRHREGIEIAQRIADKGYQIYLQAAGTMAYTDEELIELAKAVNGSSTQGLSVVDTFGAMYEEDLTHIAGLLDEWLDPRIRLGFHSHNNQQLSFALSMAFVRMFAQSERSIIVDASLCGMGRGAGNTTTELLASYLDRCHHGHYDMDEIMDAIDLYMSYFQEKYQWGYSTPYFIAGLYGSHVNNIAYLLTNHRTSSRDMRAIIESLTPEERRHYDYDLLEQRYLDNQSRKVRDDEALEELRRVTAGRQVMLLAPGRSIVTQREQVQQYMDQNHPLVIGVNAVNAGYTVDYLFYCSSVRYRYSRETGGAEFVHTPKILLSNVRERAGDNELLIGFERVYKGGWRYFDNAVIDCLRLLDILGVTQVAIAGFDGFKHQYNESYADEHMPTLNPDNKWDELNDEIRQMMQDFRAHAQNVEEITFVTESLFVG
ncbi:MAG: hypothetical protein IJT34_01070 [Butyrivibrio sp.]|nr:hypothetical protein [Butyrivibrio sp.]